MATISNWALLKVSHQKQLRDIISKAVRWLAGACNGRQCCQRPSQFNKPLKLCKIWLIDGVPAFITRFLSVFSVFKRYQQKLEKALKELETLHIWLLTVLEFFFLDYQGRKRLFLFVYFPHSGAFLVWQHPAGKPPFPQASFFRICSSSSFMGNNQWRASLL